MESLIDYYNIVTNWKLIIKKYYDSEIINNIFSKHEELYGNELEVYPPKELIFNSFNYFNIEDTKVVIIGQDPYINKNEAMGLSFSVPNGTKIPPSLRNIFKEINNDLNIENNNTDLTCWAQQGILLLNASLTVLQGKSNSHKKYWKNCLPNLIEYLSENYNNIVFILWGNDAHKVINNIKNKEKHLILKSVHPSPLSASRGFFGNNHFSKTNEYLISNNKTAINWKT